MTLLTLFCLIVASGVSFGFWLKSIGIFDLTEKNISAIVQYKHFDNSVVYDSDNKKIGEFFSFYHIFVPYEDIPKEMIQALISVEDRNFFNHPGFDLKGIARAIVSRLKKSKLKTRCFYTDATTCKKFHSYKRSNYREKNKRNSSITLS